MARASDRSDEIGPSWRMSRVLRDRLLSRHARSADTPELSSEHESQGEGSAPEMPLLGSESEDPQAPSTCFLLWAQAAPETP